MKISIRSWLYDPLTLPGGRGKIPQSISILGTNRLAPSPSGALAPPEGVSEAGRATGVRRGARGSKVLTFTLMTTFLTACSVGPKPNIPPAPLPQHWDTTKQVTRTATSETLQHWWTNFNDPVLNQLIEHTAQRNLDIKIAAARIRQARASYSIATGGLLPNLNTSASYSHLRGGIAQGLTGVGIAPGSSSNRASVISPFTTDVFQFGFDANWELDFFGGLHHARDVAEAEYAAAAMNRQDALVTILAEVGRRYLELRGLQQRVNIVRNNIASQHDTVILTEVRARAGLAPELDVTRARAQLVTTEAVLPQLEQELAVLRHRLNVLLVNTPPHLRKRLEETNALPTLPRRLPLGQPPELLFRRPDLRRAALAIAAATAQIGVAEAEQYPKIMLTGIVGRQATTVEGLRLGLGNFFSIGPGVKLPLFAGGRLKANIQLQKGRLDEAQHHYENLVLNAVEEVGNALAGYQQEQHRQGKLHAAVEQQRLAEQLATELYLKGLGDFLAVLEAQKARFQAEDALAESETARAVQLIALYKALGGGWEDANGVNISRLTIK